MASSKKSPKPAPPPPVPRLYLATLPLADPAALLAQLPQMLGAFDIAAVLLRLAPADERSLITRVKAIAPAVQKAGAALLLDQHYGIVARSGADGAHVSGIEAMREAMPSLKPERILGVGGLHTRHDAMVAGEAGADYVLFGEPDTQGVRPSTDAIFERLQWWAELFEPPCVGYAATLDEARAFAASGAEFIMAADFIWSDVRGPAAALADATSAIVQAHSDMFAKAPAGQD
ncbi:MAG: thiamine phosphate synthase [Bradyrhizobiaceae bacterium]|nr:MAG: thiamine phosphate synthase [Bradyrhizobiaceae bacterium]